MAALCHGVERLLPMVTDLVYHETFLKHVIAPGHPERPERIERSLSSIRDAGLLGSDEVCILSPSLPDMRDILRVHDSDYIERIESMSRRGGGYFTLDTAANAYTYEAALLAASGGVAAVDRIWQERAENAFVMCRPPGHHAEYDRAMGFCFINNIAVAAEHLVDVLGADRVLIVDYDGHHGNGTQNTFYSTSKVLYVGLHQDGRTLFPGSGFPDEMGTGEGRGYTVNLPVYPGAGDKSYDMLFTEIIEPVADSYKPDFVLVSTGFDCHFSDGLTNLGLTLSGIAMMNSRLMEIAGKHSQGRIAFFLEGGYNLDVLSRASLNLAEELSGREVTRFQDQNSENRTCLETTEALVRLMKSSLEGVFF